ncbi:MAG: HAD hydrolase family protein [Clostridia bacterium]|nr:HAD hydrolase family protein [Clostridia bacterium]
MDQLPFRAVIVDFDRTLLHTDKTVSDYTVKVLREWQETGARLFAATARPERTIGAYCEKIPFDAVTTLNGARTITPDTVFEEPVSIQSAESILGQLCTVDGMVISAETGSGFFANTDIPVWSPIVTDDIRQLPRKEKIYKLLASHPLLPADQISISLPEDTYSTVAEGKLLQIMSSTATKWNGVRKMLDAYGIDAARAIYFGDDNDDIGPIRECGCGVAVSNALDCVRTIADHVTRSNDEDGVAFFLAGLLRNQISF